MTKFIHAYTNKQKIKFLYMQELFQDIKNSLKAHLLICEGRKFRSSEEHLNVKNVVKYIVEKHFKENMKKKCDQAKNVIDFNWKAIMKNKR